MKCKDYGSQCFDTDNTFDVSFDENDLSFLTDNLSDGEGYWTAITVPNTENAWIIENGALKAIPFDTPNIGVRPVITIDKSLVERGEGND